MATTGWKFPGTCTNVDRDSKTAWVSPGNAGADDANYTFNSCADSDYGDWLEVTNFGFDTGDVPSGATIDGIEIEIERYGSASDVVRDDSLRLLDKDGNVDGDDKADTETYWPNTAGTATYGGAADDWNWNGDDTDVRDSDFGFRLSIYTGGTSETGFLDYIKCRIHYTTSVVVTPSPATAVASKNDPTVVANFEFTPTPASAVCGKSDPTVVQGSITVTPSPATAVASKSDPTVAAGLVFTPAPASVVCGKSDPSVVLGSLALTPTAISAVATRAPPTVVQSSITITPSPSTAVASGVDPTISADFTFTPSPVTAVAAKSDPTIVQTSTTATPTPASTVAASSGPTVSIGVNVTASSPATAVTSTSGPTVGISGERVGYKIIIYNSSGTPVARLREWERLFFTQVDSGPGHVEITTPNNDKAQYLVNGNYIVVTKAGTDAFTGKFDWEERGWNVEGEGTEMLTIRGPSIERLPQRQIVRPAASDEESHTDNVDDAIKAFVRNCYESGHADASRALSGFSVEADDAEHPNSKTLAGEYQDMILDKLQQWHDAYDIDWWVDSDIPNQTFTFRTKYPRRGSDKSSTVYFTVSRKNVRAFKYTKDSHDKANVVYVGGPGEGQAQTVSEVYSGAEPTGWDRREMYVGAPDAEYSDELDMVGNAALSVFGDDVENVTFEYNETDGCKWIDDFEVGDKVTAYDPTYDVTVAAKIEQIEVEVLRVKPDIVENIEIRVGPDQANAWERYKNKIGPFSKFDDDSAPAAPSNVGYSL